MFIVELVYAQVEYDEMFSKDNTMAGPGSQVFFFLQNCVSISDRVIQSLKLLVLQVSYN